MTSSKVLLVDDDPKQRKLTGLRLIDAGYLVATAANAEEAMAEALANRPDIIVSDVLMGDVDGFAFCRQVRSCAALAGVPVILLSAHYQRDADRRLGRDVGAFALLPRSPDFEPELGAVRDALANRMRAGIVESTPALYESHLRANARQLTQLLSQAANAEQRFQSILKNASDAITLATPEGIIVDANEKWSSLLGIDVRTMIGQHITAFGPSGSREANEESFRRGIEPGAGRADAVPFKRADGKTIYLEFSLSLLELEGGPIVLSIGRDVTNAVLAARALAAAEAKYRSVVERMPDVIWTTTTEGEVTFLTPNIMNLVGYSVDEVLAETNQLRARHVHPEDRATVAAAFRTFVTDGKAFDLEFRCQHRDGRWLWLRHRSTSTFEQDGERLVEGVLSDVTEKRALEASLLQAQKMDAIGQLTGGIAHDFNNILAAILANAHFLIDDLAPGDPRRCDAEEIKAAAERAAGLTRQLLAFSRRQVLAPATIDLNSAVAGIETMLRRLIGEDIEFSVVESTDAGAVRVDVGQIEQVIMNLVVNARDAMPTGGKLSIETTSIELTDPRSESGNADVVPAGRYVVLAISDTGCGMDEETKKHIFEPFFTTKGVGVGTGLGLSTCYGIVKQSGGHIWVFSEPGRGSVFKILFPRADFEIAAPVSLAASAGGGNETILVIEDDERVRTAVQRMLSMRGYKLLIADPAHVSEILRERRPIDLILSDVVMPGTNGPDVVSKVREWCPNARALFMSGYTNHAVLRDGVLHAGMSFIQKPFAPETLAKKVREVLDS